MARYGKGLFERATAEIHALGDEITRRKKAAQDGNGMTAEMRASSAMLRAGLECHGKEAQALSLNMLTKVAAAATRRGKENVGLDGLELRAQADKMVQAVLDAESAIR